MKYFAVFIAGILIAQAFPDRVAEAEEPVKAVKPFQIVIDEDSCYIPDGKNETKLIRLTEKHGWKFIRSLK